MTAWSGRESMSAVSAMKCTPQKTIASASGLRLGGVRELERVAHEVGVLHDLVALVEVAEHHDAVAERRLGGAGCASCSSSARGRAVLLGQLALARRVARGSGRPSTRRGRRTGASRSNVPGRLDEVGACRSRRRARRCAMSWMVVSTDAMVLMRAVTSSIGARLVCRADQAVRRWRGSGPCVGEVDRGRCSGTAAAAGGGVPVRYSSVATTAPDASIVRRKFAGSSARPSTASCTSRSWARVKRLAEEGVRDAASTPSCCAAARGRTRRSGCGRRRARAGRRPGTSARSRPRSARSASSLRTSAQ